MKKLIGILLLACVGCNESNTSQKNEPEDMTIEEGEVTSASTADTLCFVFTHGKNNEDTQAVKLLVNGNVVEGKLMYMPAEKDWRFGNLRGQKTDNVFDMMWTYVQEGMKDSTQVLMKLEGDKLMQKEFSYHPETGREFIADSSQFSIIYSQVDCENFPKHDFDLGI